MTKIHSLLFIVLSVVLFSAVTEARSVGTTDPIDSCDYIEHDCTSRPLANGRAGETVRECKIQTVCTQVTHVGR
jgi:hypothetical protein